MTVDLEAAERWRKDNADLLTPFGAKLFDDLVAEVRRHRKESRTALKHQRSEAIRKLAIAREALEWCSVLDNRFPNKSTYELRNKAREALTRIDRPEETAKIDGGEP